jgi:ABC-type phosphate/phosphonate transport system substrate-binding protein
MFSKTIVMGAVCYAPRVKQVWEGTKEYLASKDFPYDYVLFENYGDLVVALLSGAVDLTWNSPLSFVASRRFGQERGVRTRGIVMRDTDRDVRTSFVAHRRSTIHSLADLHNKRIGMSEPFAPEATLLPLEHLDRHGLQDERDFTRVTFDLPKAAGGPLPLSIMAALEALMEGRVDACCMRTDQLERLAQVVPAIAQQCREIGQTEPYDHCIFATRADDEHPLTSAFVEHLLAMSYDDPHIRQVFDLEALKRWVPGRETHFDTLERATRLYGLPRGIVEPCTRAR